MGGEAVGARFPCSFIMEKNMNIAFQGEHGAYSEQAVFDYFGHVETLPCETFDLVFDAVALGKADSGLI
ncbi:MAG: prephenate dehydratase domain-containing protein, partial [Anaerolineales bacterium]